MVKSPLSVRELKFSCRKCVVQTIVFVVECMVDYNVRYSLLAKKMHLRIHSLRYIYYTCYAVSVSYHSVTIIKATP